MKNTLLKYFKEESLFSGHIYRSYKESPKTWADFSPVTYKAELLNIKEEEAQKYYFVSNFLSFGDYDNSCHVERSNVAVFLEEFGHLKGIEHIYGCYGSEAIAINLAIDCNPFLDVLEALESYPVIDDEHALFYELDMIQEAWDSFGRSDMELALAEKYEMKYSADEVRERGNFNGGLEYVQAGGVVYFDIEKMIDNFHADCINKQNMEA